MNSGRPALIYSLLPPSLPPSPPSLPLLLSHYKAALHRTKLLGDSLETEKAAHLDSKFSSEITQVCRLCKCVCVCNIPR